MSEKYHVAYLDESQYDAWDRFVDTSLQGSIYSKSFFLRALTEASGTQFKIMAVYKGEEIVGGVGLHYTPGRYGKVVERRGLLFYNGLIFRNHQGKYPSKQAAQQINVTRELINALENDGFASVSLSMPAPVPDTRVFTWVGWQVYPQYSYQVPIADMDKLWGRVEQNARRLITRCQRDGQYVEARDDFDCFYTMHKATYNRIGLEPYFSQETFRRLYETLRDRGNAELFFAMMPDGQPASAQVVLSTDHPVTHTWVAGADRDYAQTGVSALLRWEVFRIYSERGYACNDLTDAMNESVARFKAQFGGDLVYCPIVSQVNSRALRMQQRMEHNLIEPARGLVQRLRPASTKPTVEHAEEM